MGPDIEILNEINDKLGRISGNLDIFLGALIAFIAIEVFSKFF